MKKDTKIPKRLYKYRYFSDCTLDMIVCDQLFYANPASFNDPLDTRPSLAIDLADGELEKIIRILVKQRIAAEMRAAAKTMRVRGAKTIDYIERAARRLADHLIAEIEYGATEPGYDSEDYKRYLLRHHVEVELLRRYEKGIVSLSERANCPLMWSHYGDEHRGICVGYSVPASTASDVHKVAYGVSRLVQASKVAAMLNGDDVARSQVDEAVFLRKAGSWRYEREWRLIGRYGLQDSPLELEEIIFGMRCKESAKYVVMKALESRERPVKFYVMREELGTFNLKRYALNYDDELFLHFPRRCLSISEAWEP